LHLRIHSQTEKLNLVRDFIAEAAREVGFDDEATGKIMLAVDEACTNIIKHAYKSLPNRDIDLDVKSNGKRFEIEITHDGASFDPLAVKRPDMKEYLRKYQHGGLGIHLMRTLMDKVEYQVLPDRRNIVRLVKYLPVNVQRQK
jgi:serine/threonine-protein kinase RsbW